MKIIDETPFFNENGEIKPTDRVKAMLQFGPGWFKEMEAQKTIVSVFNKALDRNFTLLRNVTPPGLDARIPFILVGPAGVYVMYVTPMKGMFRAKGDEWGTVVGGAYKPEKPNLLIRTQKMALAIQVFLQRQGFADITSVEPILLCSDPSVTVDSLRPIIRVVMSDALERLAISISQARVIMTPETAYNVVKRLQAPVTSAPQEPAAETPPPETMVDASNPPEVPAEVSRMAEPSISSFMQPEPQIEPAQPVNPLTSMARPEEAAPRTPRRRRSRARVSGRQWALLLTMFVVWLIIIAIFIYIVFSGL